MGKKEIHDAEENFYKTVSAASMKGISFQKEEEGGDEKAEDPKFTNALASLEAVLEEVQAS